MKAMRVVVVLVLLALVAAVVVLATGGFDDDGDDGDDSASEGASQSLAPTPTPQPGSTEPPDPALAAFYGQTLAWQRCPDGEGECGSLTVPLDYQQPGGETLELAVVRIPAADRDARIGSMVVDPGGPGASAIDYARGSWGDALTEQFDIVGMDPRGVGRSQPVDCLSDEEMDTYLASDPDPDDSGEEADFRETVEGFGAGCEAKSGDLAAHVSTIEAARDMDVLRSALGETHLTYFGASYGTELGATYAEFFPDRVGRLVLDGAVDPSLTHEESALAQARGFETALRSYVQNCLDEGDCYLGDSLEAALERIGGLLDDVDQEPLPTRMGDRMLTEGLTGYGIAAALYSRDAWVYLDQGLEGAFNGDGTILALLADAYAHRDPDGAYADNLLEAFPTISCLDDPSFVPFDEVPSHVAEFEAASPTFGRSSAWALTTCAGFTARSTETPRPLRGAGAAPIVVIGTTRDPATPYEEAIALADQLESGVLVSRDGDGHTAYHSGNDCIDHAVEDYLVAGTVPKDGLEC